MKKQHIQILFLAILWVIYSSCGNNPIKKNDVAEANPIIQNESDELLNFLEKSGNFLNTSKSPAIIQPQDVFENLDEYLIIDLRSHEEYVDGHIDGAKNTSLEKLLEFLNQEVIPSAFEKIVLVCNNGQSASYAAGVLRLIGYGNTYAMKWGMSGWNKQFASDYWIKNIGNKATNLDTNLIDKPAKNKMFKYPQIHTGKRTTFDIAKERAKQILIEGYKKVSIKYDTLMKNPDKFFIINYWTIAEFKQGHLKNAYQYQPKESFSKSGFLTTLPTNQPIVVYCFTGHTSAFVVAYLRMLGFDAYSLSYGTNSFMNAKMISNEIINKAFVANRDIQNYPTIEGEEATIKKEVTSIATDNSKNQTKSVEKKDTPKKKKTGGGGGC